jgi:sialic acid synthase SpsE
MLAGAVDFLKIASFERQDKELRRASMELGVSVIQSHGLGGQPDYYCEQLVHLRCVSAYPAPLQSLRLRLIRSRRSGWYHGLSDHSKDVRTGGWAVAAGATVLEVHLAHPSAGADNLDLACALQPAEFAEYVKNARDAWTACTGTTMDQSEAESPMLPYLVPR